MRVKYLDVLKAFAIIAVVLYHCGFLTYGYLGVDLFLVINGYLITKGLKDKILNNSVFWGGYVEFEISRIVRLLPPLMVAGVVAMIVGFFNMLPDDYENLGQSIIASNVFGNNILAAITTKNYWDVSNDYKPFMHTWYVGLVMQFYVIYPILFYLAGLDKKTPQKTLLTLISSLAIVSLLIYFGTDNVAQRFYYLPARFFEFAAGGILALIYKPTEDNKPFNAIFVYICYALLLILLIVNKELIPDNIKLVLVVALSCVLICSKEVLENRVSGNNIFAKIGVASYSIFVWHQVILAFYRYMYSSKFSILTFVLYIAITSLLAYLSYCFIEKPTSKWLKTKKTKRIFYATFIAIFISLNGFAAYIYISAGVVRDIPELYVTIENKHRGMHAEYCDRGYKYDKPFETEKLHWFVIGNSFGRDFVNVILESDIADKVEISYTSDFKKTKNVERFKKADKVFISTLGLNEELVTEIEVLCLANNLLPKNIVIVGEKNFGESNGQIYVKRNSEDYFEQYIEVEDRERFITKNKYFSEIYRDRFLDLMKMVTNNENKVKVFSPSGHFISADCRHFSKGGAEYFASLIDWNKYLE
ncbi:MAG: acyltransferase [Bacteroidales bacterium]|nr:acyltransferase [Bacteroidales bacterium]